MAQVVTEEGELLPKHTEHAGREEIGDWRGDVDWETNREDEHGHLYGGLHQVPIQIRLELAVRFQLAHHLIEILLHRCLTPCTVNQTVLRIEFAHDANLVPRQFRAYVRGVKDIEYIGCITAGDIQDRYDTTRVMGQEGCHIISNARDGNP